MPGEGVEGVRAAPAGASPEELIAQRLRLPAVLADHPRRELASPSSVQQWLEGDAGRLHEDANLRALPIASHRRMAGSSVVALKRMLRRLLYPLVDVQSDLNAANARIVTFLLEQLAAHAERIAELQREVAELRADREP